MQQSGGGISLSWDLQGEPVSKLFLEADEDDSEDHSLIELTGDTLLEIVLDPRVLRIKPSEVRLAILAVPNFLLVDFTEDAQILAGERLPERADDEEDFNGSFFVVEELGEGDFEDTAGLVAALLGQLSDARCTLP